MRGRMAPSRLRSPRATIPVPQILLVNEPDLVCLSTSPLVLKYLTLKPVLFFR
jgi:hypothetical protein